MSWFNRGLIAVFALLVTACAAKLPDVERNPSYAFDGSLETRVGQRAQEEALQHADGESGFALLRHGRNAFAARIGLTKLAERTLDVQYYIWEPDTTGKLLAQRLVDAADRGVRVRILVDDNNMQGRDSLVVALDAHPKIEVRVFNPFAHRSRHLFDFATDLGRVNHRMHNKVMIVDSALGIVGGRNIGDHYFGVNEHANFRDLDIAATGPVVASLAESFDYFWNGDWSYPISTLVDPANEKDLRDVKSQVESALRDAPYPYPVDQDIAALADSLAEIFATMVWAKGWVVADDPAAIGESTPGIIKQSSMRLADSLQKELLVESAYFVQTGDGVAAFAALVDRGVRVRVLTNSLASNDVAAAHAGYAKTRKDLLKAGVELYELRADSGVLKQEWSVAGGDSKAALHTKSLEFDGEAVFIGSYNLDPRSANINTEIGIYVESVELASQLKAYLDQGVSPENAYHVTLDADGKLEWDAANGDEKIQFSKEPNTGWWQRFVAGFIQLLPVQSQL